MRRVAATRDESCETCSGVGEEEGGQGWDWGWGCDRAWGVGRAVGVRTIADYWTVADCCGLLRTVADGYGRLRTVADKRWFTSSPTPHPIRRIRPTHPPNGPIEQRTVTANATP